MSGPKIITEIEHDDSEIDGLQQCLDYLSTYEDPPVPVRSPNRQAKYYKTHESKYGHHSKPKLHEMPLLEQDELLISDASSSEYLMSSDESEHSSIFSDHSRAKQLDLSDDEAYMNEISSGCLICNIDNVVTIVRKHDRWDPKKVSFVSIPRC